MRIILGIGNPGNRYKNNRHNVGFILLDSFAQKYSLTFKPSKSDYFFCEGELGGNRFSLVKPSTYVNNSGLAALDVVDKYKVDVTDLLAVYDDINLDHAAVRVKPSGGDGGHNGIGSVIYHLASDQFPRLRVGVGSNFEKGQMADYVLSDFSEEETEKLGGAFKDAIMLMEEFISGGVKQMLDANSKLLKTKNDNNLLNNN